MWVPPLAVQVAACLELQDHAAAAGLWALEAAESALHMCFTQLHVVTAAVLRRHQYNAGACYWKNLHPAQYCALQTQ